MSMKHLLTIFQGEGDNEHEIDIAIIKALLKGKLRPHKVYKSLF